MGVFDRKLFEWVMKRWSVKSNLGKGLLWIFYVRIYDGRWSCGARRYGHIPVAQCTDVLRQVTNPSPSLSSLEREIIHSQCQGLEDFRDKRDRTVGPTGKTQPTPIHPGTLGLFYSFQRPILSPAFIFR